jgi:IS30 family transposase
VEGDGVIGADRKKTLVTLVERKSGFAVLSHVTRKTSDLVSQAIITSLAPMAQRVRTVTYDNGKEFADHAVVDEALKLTA